LPITTPSLKNKKKGHLFKRVTLLLNALVSDAFLKIGRIAGEYAGPARDQYGSDLLN